MRKKIVVRFFTWYISRIIANDFSSFTFNKVDVDKSKAILLVANHFSWWDGFLMYQLNRLVFKKNFHVLVTEKNYKNVGFLKYLGAFPVKKKSRSMMESLNYAGGLLNDQKNLVLVFPQGRLFSNHVEEVRFEKGLMYIVNASQKNFQYLLSASFVDYFEKRKPSVTCYLRTCNGAEFASIDSIKTAYNNHYETSRNQHSRLTV